MISKLYSQLNIFTVSPPFRGLILENIVKDTSSFVQPTEYIMRVKFKKKSDQKKVFHFYRLLPFLIPLGIEFLNVIRQNFSQDTLFYILYIHSFVW